MSIEKVDLEGVWTGQYHYRKTFGLTLMRPVQFHAVFERRDEESLRGRIYEPNTFGRRSAEHLEADIQNLELSGDAIRFRKQYDGTGGARHGIDYEGTLSADGLQISGTWKIGWLTSGTFDMTKESGETPAQFLSLSNRVPTLEQRKVPRWPIYFVAGFILFIMLISLWNIRLSPEARDANAFLTQMPLERITEIRLEPNPYSPASFTHITDRKQIAELAAAFRNAVGISPSHPRTQWSVTVRFITPEREYGGHVTQTSNQGVLFWYSSNVTSGWNYGTYRNDALAPLIQRMIAEKPMQ